MQQRAEDQAVDESGDRSHVGDASDEPVAEVPAAKPSVDVVTVQQRTVEQVIDVSPEKPREESAPQSRTVEQVC